MFCEDISVEYEFKSVKFKGGIDGIDRLKKMNNLDPRGNTAEFKTIIVLYYRRAQFLSHSFLLNFSSNFTVRVAIKS